MRDLQGFVGGFVDKVYHPTLDHLVLSVRLPSEGKGYIHFWVGKWLYRSDKGQEGGKQPSDFAMMLRKRITNAKIASVQQQGFDRIVVMTLERDGLWELVFELFAEGNVILVRDSIIVQPLTSHTWKHRDVRAKRDFAFPPPVPDPSVLTPDAMLDILHSSDTDLVRTIATKLNTGGRYSEEICARADLAPRMDASLTTPEMARNILETIRAIMRDISKASKGYVVLRDSGPDDVVPLKMKTYEGLKTEEFDSFSAAVEAYMPRMQKPKKEKPKEAVLELERLKRKLAQQESAVTTFQDDAREAQLMGDFLFANYIDLQHLLTDAKRRLLSGLRMEDIPGYVAFNEKDKTLKVKFKDTIIELDVRGSVETNAQQYYEESKEARKKLVGLLAIIDEARSSVDEASRGLAVAKEEKAKAVAPTKKFWFERFRWFISSEDALVIGGKDAKSNDMLVKKHLKPGDRYAHADVHGAPSVVVKMKDGVTEKTLHEACEFAVATSKAWNAKIGSAAGYWVLPEQVSKTPQSGEHLAKGAFVIRGKRNYTEKLGIKLAVGEVEYEGYRKVMCGPVDAVKTKSKKYMVIRPGETDKNELAKKLAAILSVPIEEIQSVLPPGDVKVEEQVGLAVPTS